MTDTMTEAALRRRIAAGLKASSGLLAIDEAPFIMPERPIGADQTAQIREQFRRKPAKPIAD